MTSILPFLSVLVSSNSLAFCMPVTVVKLGMICLCKFIASNRTSYKLHMTDNYVNFISSEGSTIKTQKCDKIITMHIKTCSMIGGRIGVPYLIFLKQLFL